MGRKILLIGIGRSGCTVAERFVAKMRQNGLCVSAIAMDTDETGMSEYTYATPIPMVDNRSLYSVVETLGAENISDWFPCDWERDHTEFIKNLRMDQGSNLWRMKAYLSFVSFLSKPRCTEKLHAAIDAVFASGDETAEADEVELYVVASLAGGTGSGLFLPVTLYVKKYVERMGHAFRSSVAALAMPDIYENSFTAEQRIKSYANAYTALREYNAVLLSTNASDEAEKHPPISFKLGVDGGVPELLFDAGRSEYRTPSANPFDGVYLFERVPNVVSVDVHMDILSDIVVSLCNREKQSGENEDNNQTKALNASDAIFGGVSLVKVRYPVESIVKYISSKQVSDLFAAELCKIHQVVMAELERKRGEARLYEFAFTEDAEQYSETYLAVCDDVIYESETPLSLMGRDEKLFENDVTAEGAFDMDYLAPLTRLVETSIACESAKQLQDILHPPVEPDEDGEDDAEENAEDGAEGDDDAKTKHPKKAKKPRKPKPPKVKKKSRAQLAEDAVTYGELLTDFYRHGLRCIKQGSEAFEASLFDGQKDVKEFSVLHHLLMKDGQYLHPVLAMWRLCKAYCQLERLASAADDRLLTVNDIDTAELPQRLIRVAPAASHRSTYFKLGDKRFETLIRGGEGMAYKAADDESLFMYDLEQVYSQLSSKLKACRYRTVRDAIGKLIDKYRHFVNILHTNVREDIVDDERLSLRNNSANTGISVNVGASETEKKALWNAYIDGYRRTPEAVSAYTARMGELMYGVLKDHKDTESVRPKILAVVEEMESLFARQCKDSQFYQDRLEKNILEVVLASCDDPGTGMTLSKVFVGRTLPLHVTMPESFAEYRTVKNGTKAVLSESMKAYITDSMGRDDHKTYIEELMYSAGEYSGVAEFASYVPAKEILLRSETENLRPYFVNAINEMSPESTAYGCYLKAKEAQRKLCTKMWDPALVHNVSGNARLPYINPQMQADYERKVAKAVLMALRRGDIRISAQEGAGDIYVLQNGVDVLPMYWGADEAFIMQDQPHLLMLWAYEREAWTLEYAAMFDRKEREELNRIPTAQLGVDNVAVVKRAIGRSEILSLMQTHMPTLVAGLCRADVNDGGFAATLAELATQTLRAYCIKGFGTPRDENYISVYNKHLALVTEEIAAQAETLGTEASLENLYQKGYLMQLNLSDTLA